MEVRLDNHPYLDPRWHEFYQHLGQKNPSDPDYISYLREKAAVERRMEGQESEQVDSEHREVDAVEPASQQEQSDEEYCKEMLKLAEEEESSTEDLSNDDIIRLFADGGGPFAEGT